MQPIINYQESKYKSVAPLTTDTTGGIIIPNGENVYISKFVGDGVDANSYVLLAWDYGGGSQIIFYTASSNVERIPDSTNPTYQITGDGVKAIKVILVNNLGIPSSVIGGSVEVTKLG